MLRSLKDLEGYSVVATDGDIGSVVNFFLDDQRWVVRYLVAETGIFLDRRQVLISPISFRQADWSTRRFFVALTMDKVKNSPGADVDKPVSRQHERDYNSYYGYPYYWGSSGIWGMGSYPSVLTGGSWTAPSTRHSDETSGDVHLRSVAAVRGYHIQGSDEAIGHVEDFLVDDETWEVRYLVVDTSNWWFGKKVLIAPQWASRVSWEQKKVYVDMSREQIQNSPEWDETAADRAYEARLHEHHGRVAQWPSDDRPQEAQAAPQR